MRSRVWLLLFCCCFGGQAQWPGVEFKAEPGTALESRYDHAMWASPESIVRDLRSDDDGARAKALRLFGYPEAELLDALKSDEIELRYAAIGDNKTLQAIVTITVDGVRPMRRLQFRKPRCGNESALSFVGASMREIHFRNSSLFALQLCLASLGQSW